MQLESIDDDLRNGLWNALTTSYWIHMRGGAFATVDSPEEGAVKDMVTTIWADHYKQPTDSIPRTWSEVYNNLRNAYFNAKWHEVYDFLEFVANNDAFGTAHSLKFVEMCNFVLERESSAYRFVDHTITQITGEEEIAQIEQAINSVLKPVSQHMERALTLLSDRKSPDYRNSIKESISAVEAICGVIAGRRNATLGQALDRVEKKVELHPALKGAFDKLYGYTSSGDGIRHALLQETDLDFADAKFMLVACSAFVNYLTSKSSDAGISLS